MGIHFDVLEIDHELDALVAKFESIDMEQVKRSTLERIAEEASEMVRAAIFESDINAPATTGPYESGPGPSIIDRDAWNVEPVSDSMYTLEPHPEVRQRAVVLNDGYPGRIYPDGDNPLRFTVNGVPVFAEWVEGPDPTNYWDVAFRKLEGSEAIATILKDELRRELEESF